MSSVNSLLGNAPGEVVIGTYLHPYRLLGTPDWNDDSSATAVVAKVRVNDTEILVTRNGGLFLVPPKGLATDFQAPVLPDAKHFQRQLEFLDAASVLFNLLICEFTLSGVVSEPASPTHIGRGKLVDNHALVNSGGGSREMYMERTVIPTTDLIRGTWRMYQQVGEEVLTQVWKLERAMKLMQVAGLLPALVAGAYSLFSRRQLGEALIDSGIVIEQIVDYLWEDYRNGLTDNKRRERLKDDRTYSTGVRVEILHSIGRLPEDLYKALNLARKHRNDMAHRAVLTLTAATETIHAMKQMIELHCGSAVASPSTYNGICW